MYIILVSIHGLIRGHQLELGRDADTGGQTQYIVDLAKALSRLPEVEQIDLVTRQILDPKVSKDYGQPVEKLTDQARIVRLACGGKRYLRKEVLWPYLDVFADELLRHIRLSSKVPTVIHSHYADAGYVGMRVANWLGIPLIHTGHSLGRVKRQHLLEQGTKPESIEEQFNFNTRIEAEENVLENAALIITSTHQEIQEQYRLYDHYTPDRMVVIPPGIDAERFHAIPKPNPPIKPQINCFFSDPEKPIILALSRPVPRKNIQMLVRAYGESQELRSLANLLLVLGSREDIREMETAPRQVLTELLLLIDRYNLYGSVAYPKSHRSEDVVDIYHLVVQSRGVLINPALTEPFGLTLIEAAACGLPIIAPNDGGPRDIIDNCQNGLLIDPLDINSIQQAIHQSLTNANQWQERSIAGIEGVQKYYTWDSHIKEYIKQINNLTNKPVVAIPRSQSKKSRLLTVDRLIISDIDNTLLGDREALAELINYLGRQETPIGFGIATGRSIESAQKILAEWEVPLPDLWITSVGSEIHYGSQIQLDTSWQRYISHRWQPELIKRIMQKLPGIELQSLDQQRSHKVSYLVDPTKSLSIREIQAYLRRHKLHVRTIYSHQQFLDLLPLRASKGDAVRYCAIKWSFPLNQLLVAGDSGNDEQMLIGNTKAVVVGNHSPELEKLRGQSNVFFAKGCYAQGILEAISHYEF
jgi:sucrose-phosphate synthase